ncbi:ABC-type transporter, integral membrane subunit OS=Streptomyces sp. ACT-1 OX=1609288 GN=SACT1_4378 PE=3 SV=1 [Streptomyces griseus subsp. griseus]
MATVSTVALTTVGSLVGKGGLGNLIEDALPSFFKAQVLTAAVLCVLLAVAADLLLLGLQRLLTPWTRISGAVGAAPAKTDAGPPAPATVKAG